MNYSPQDPPPADAALLNGLASYLVNVVMRFEWADASVATSAHRLRALAAVLEGAKPAVTDQMINAAFVVLVARHVDARGEIHEGDITREMVREALSAALYIRGAERGTAGE
jgi:hypothetical protein